jgi:AraC-like DNA-binding protein
MNRRICAYIDSHLAEKLHLEELANLAGFSVHHFARAFRHSVGMSPHHYILQRRLQQAKRMLRETELSVAEIALSAGFSDQSHLTRHFRRLTGLPPSAARWRQR